MSGKHFAWIVLLLLIPACASDPGYRVRHPAPPSAEMRSRMGRICLVVCGDEPHVIVREPNKRVPAGFAGFFIGGAGGFAAGGLAALATGPGAVFAAPLFIPVGTVIGAVAGAAGGATMGSPSREDQARGDIQRKAIGTLDLRDIARSEAGAWADATSGRHLRRQDIAAAGPDSSAQTILEMKVISFGVRLPKDRQAQAFVAIRTRLIDQASQHELYYSVLDHISDSRPFEQWAEQDGAALRQEVESGCRRLVKQSAEEVFVK